MADALSRHAFAETWQGGETIPTTEEEPTPLCIYCNTDSQTNEDAPYCCDICAIDAQEN